MGKRVEWDDLDVLFEDEEPLPEGAEVILPDYDYDGGFTDEEILDQMHHN